MPRAKKTIPARHLTRTASLVFSRESLSGGDFSRRMKANYHTIRRKFMEQGVTSTEAKKAATVLRAWSTQLEKQAAKLERLAQ
jgi:hypothetical protein